MPKATGVAERLTPLLQRLFDGEPPVRIRAWDGSEAGPVDAPAVVVRSRRALRRLLWQPNELGLGRAYVAGEIEVDGDLFEMLRRLAPVAYQERFDGRQLSAADRRQLMKTAVLLGALGPEPKPPPEEASLSGDQHSHDWVRAAITHHYDVGNDFYRLVLGPALVYSCAYWATDAADYSLEDAQQDKLDLICRKLGLTEGMRLLDVGCGWGSLVVHAAREYGVRAVGVTLSPAQAELAGQRVSEAGVADRVRIGLQDYSEVADGPYDAIASVGMAEHLSEERYANYCAHLFGLLRPGGRLLDQQITRWPGLRRTDPTFIQSYVFPDNELKPLSTVVGLLEVAGFEVRDVESLREHYARTLRRWVANLQANWETAVALTTLGRARVWQLYMAGSALAFEAGRIGVNQIVAVRAHPDGRSGMPSTRAGWL